MDIEKVKKKDKGKSSVMSIRVNEENSAWMKKNEISPQAVFNEAIKELREKVKKQK